MFYDNFISYCNNVNKAPSAVASELGLSRASVNGWKHGKVPTDANQKRIADYFGISVADLMSEQKEKPAQAQTNTSELDQAFFRVMKSAQDKGYSPHDIELALDFIKRARERDQK